MRFRSPTSSGLGISPPPKTSTETQNVVIGVSQSLKGLIEAMCKMPRNRKNLSISILVVVQAVGKLVGRLLELEEKLHRQQEHMDQQQTFVQQQQEHIAYQQKYISNQQRYIDRNRDLFENVDANMRIMTKFDNLNNGVVLSADTIFGAILYIKDKIGEYFPGVSIRIVLTPTQDGQENSIAQMLADTLSMAEARSSEPDFIMTPDEKYEKNRLDSLVEVLLVTEDALNTDQLPKGIHLLRNKDISMTMEDGKCVLTQQEITRLDPEIFGTPLSGRVNNIPGVGMIVFLSNTPDYYSANQDSYILDRGLKTLGGTLMLIGKSEENEKDHLTGLLLRRNFEAKAQKLFDVVKNEEGEDISFAFIDADHFKQVNDTYGHAAGDFVLKTLAGSITRMLKDGDIKVRWGGEEFGVLMRANTEDTENAIQRVFGAFKRIVFQITPDGTPSIHNNTAHLDSNNRTFSVTLSAGIASNEETLEKLMDQADKRLYSAKQGGRDRIVSANTSSALIVEK